MKVKRRRVIAASACALSSFWTPSALLAQGIGKVWRIGVLHPRSKLAAGPRDVYTNFFDGMRELGYVEGRNISVQWLFAENDLQRLPALAAELVKQRVDLIVTNGTPAVRAAQQATSSIPIIGLTFGDPVALGFAASLARPGGNVTGLSVAGPQVGAKRLEILATAVGSAPRIAFLVNPDNESLMRAALPELETAARKIGREIVTVKARSANELGTAFDLITRERVGALLVGDDTVLQDQWRVIGALALKARLPTMFPWPPAGDGALLAYRGIYTDFGRRAATLAHKIFKGVKPGDLPIEQPTNFNLVVNLKIAKALGIAVPQSVLLQASRVIE